MAEITVTATPQFIEWLDSLKDLTARARVQARLERLREGNPEQQRVLRGGICELKIVSRPHAKSANRNDHH